MSGRVPVALRERLADREFLLGSALAAVAVAGTVVALGALLFRRVGASGDGPLAAMLDSLARALPSLGALVVLASLGSVWYLRSSESTLFSATTTEPPPFATPEGMAAQFHDAIRARYRGETDDSLDQIHELLVDSAVQTVRTRRGVDVETARAAVRSGTWTDDPVAAATLAEERPFPRSDRLYGRVDPGGAYQRRVRRTLDAIETVETGREGSQ
jgi:hypothetical protein